MNKALIPFTLVVVLVTGFSFNWLHGGQPRPAARRLTMQEEIRTSDAALRHKRFEPMHWRAMVLQPH
jgi:hypothetical protein